MSSDTEAGSSDASLSPEPAGDVGAISAQLDGLLAALLPPFAGAIEPVAHEPAAAPSEPRAEAARSPTVAFRLLASHAPRQIALEAPVIELKRPERQD